MVRSLEKKEEATAGEEKVNEKVNEKEEEEEEE